jgi:di/tricarboxylate transporter
VAAVVLGALLPRRPFRTGLLLVIAPGAVVVADAAGRSPGRALVTLAIVAACGGFLGCAAGAGAAWRTGRGR